MGLSVQAQTRQPAMLQLRHHIMHSQHGPQVPPVWDTDSCSQMVSMLYNHQEQHLL
jgi:hypothetical protein